MKLEVHIDEVSREQWELHAKMFADTHRLLSRRDNFPAVRLRSQYAGNN